MYVSVGLSTYFYGLSARLHVFLRVERGQAHNSLGTAFIRSAAGVVIVFFFSFLFFVVAVLIHMRKERRLLLLLLLLLLGFYQVHLKCATEGESGSWRARGEERRGRRGRVRYLCAHLNILCILDKAHLRCPATSRGHINAHAKYSTVSLKSRAAQWCASHWKCVPSSSLCVYVYVCILSRNKQKQIWHQCNRNATAAKREGEWEGEIVGGQWRPLT